MGEQEMWRRRPYFRQTPLFFLLRLYIPLVFPTRAQLYVMLTVMKPDIGLSHAVSVVRRGLIY